MTHALAQPPLRSRVQQKPDEELLRRYAARRAPEDLEALVARFGSLAASLARRYASGGYPFDDLRQVACLGLVKALQRFDPDRGVPFPSFAVPTILGELRRHCRDTAWLAHVPRGMQERVRALRAASDDLAAARGRAPEAADLATWLGWTEEEVVATMAAAATRAPVPLERWTDEEDEAPPAPGDHLAVVDPGYEVAEHHITLEPALTTLNPLERSVLALRFDDDLPHREIAARLGIPHATVARVLESALDALRRVVGSPAGGSLAASRPAPAPALVRRAA